MPTFAYRARNGAGESVGGQLVAETQAAAARMLGERSLMPVELKELKGSGSKLSLKRGGGKVSQSKVGLLYEQLSDLLRSGVPMMRSLRVLSKQASSPELARVLREVHDEVASGETLADAFAKHPKAFPQLHVAMVRAGEAGGFLEDVLARLSVFVARQDELRNKFVTSLIYPGVLLLGTLGATIFVMTYVVPKIQPVLDGQDLPILTELVFAVSDLLKEQYIAVLLVVVALIAALVALKNSAAGQLFWARVQLRLWGIGKIYTMMSLCRFCRVFGTMLANGIQILTALKISKESMGNPILAESIEKAAENVGAGESLSRPLAQSGVFPPAIIDMIAVAEESNTLERVLVEIADTQEVRTARQIDTFMKLLEPALLAVMGGIIMLIAIALLVPILSMASSVG